MSMKALRLSLVAAVIAVLVTAAGAGAQSPADTVYNPNGEVLNVVTGGGNGGPPTDVAEDDDTPVQRESGTTPTTPTTTASGSLPFTGFEAGIVAMAGLALLGAGFAMRRVARSE